MITKGSEFSYKIINTADHNSSSKDIAEELHIGDRIKEIRQSKNLRLVDLSEVTGLSKSHISQIENQKISPSVSAIARIGKALDISLSTLFEEIDPKPNSMIKKKDRRVFIIKASGIKYELLSANFKHNLLGAAYITIKKGGSTGRELHSFKGEQFGLLLKGRLEMNLNGEKYVLEEGDSIYFKSSIPHAGKNIGDCDVEALWVVTPPNF